MRALFLNSHMLKTSCFDWSEFIFALNDRVIFFSHLIFYTLIFLKKWSLWMMHRSNSSLPILPDHHFPQCNLMKDTRWTLRCEWNYPSLWKWPVNIKMNAVLIVLGIICFSRISRLYFAERKVHFSRVEIGFHPFPTLCSHCLQNISLSTDRWECAPIPMHLEDGHHIVVRCHFVFKRFVTVRSFVSLSLLICNFTTSTLGIQSQLCIDWHS